MLTPCVLPVLPALLAASAGEGRRRVLGVVIGLEASFFVIAIALAGILSAAGLPDHLFQWVAAGLLLGFAAILTVPALHTRFQARASRLTSPIAGSVARRSGFLGGIFAGVPLGLIWTPCAGPILAGITVAGATTRFTGRTVATMVAYGFGMLGPLFAISLGGARVVDVLRKKSKGGRRVELAMGAMLAVTAVIVGLGWLNQINRFLAEAVNLTSTPTAALEERALVRNVAAPDENAEGSRMRLGAAELEVNGYPEVERLADYGRAPEFAGISRWFNSKELTLRELRGKVVLVDFWTYSCINCIRTFPHLKQWHADYADDGLVLVGVHSPEFAFEKDAGNVADAIADFDIEYAVAMDNDFETWDNFYNRYWPAHYLIDRSGTLRSVHYGEGAYDRTEAQIRRLLSLPGTGVTERAEEDSGPPRTPETYLGFLGAERFAGSSGGKIGLVPGQETDYRSPRELPLHRWSFEGRWEAGPERSVAGAGAAISLHYLARDVHIVVGPGFSGTGTMTIEDGGDPGSVTVDEYRLYTIRSGPHTSATLRVGFSPGLEVYSFTFG